MARLTLGAFAPQTKRTTLGESPPAVGMCAEPQLTQLHLKPDAVSWREVDGEIIALEHSASTYLAANASGALLWKSLAEGASRDELVTRLVDEFGIKRGQAAADTDAFLRAMVQQGLLAS